MKKLKKSQVLREGREAGIRFAIKKLYEALLSEGVYYVYDEDIKETGLSVKKALLELAPSAAKIVKVTGGYACFDTIDDYKTWKNQK